MKNITKFGLLTLLSAACSSGEVPPKKLDKELPQVEVQLVEMPSNYEVEFSSFQPDCSSPLPEKREKLVDAFYTAFNERWGEHTVNGFKDTHSRLFQGATIDLLAQDLSDFIDYQFSFHYLSVDLGQGSFYDNLRNYGRCAFPDQNFEKELISSLFDKVSLESFERDADSCMYGAGPGQRANYQKEIMFFDDIAESFDIDTSRDKVNMLNKAFDVLYSDVKKIGDDAKQLVVSDNPESVKDQIRTNHQVLEFLTCFPRYENPNLSYDSKLNAGSVVNQMKITGDKLKSNESLPENNGLGNFQLDYAGYAKQLIK